MGTNRQRFFNLLTTLRAVLRRVTGVNFDYLSSSFFRFVRKEFKEFSPACVSNTLTQMPVPYHAFNIQCFNIDGLISSYIEISYFVQKIFSLIHYFFVSLGYKDLCLASSVGTSYLAGKCSLSSSQDSFRLPEEFRVINTSSRGVNEKFLDADINPDFGYSFRDILGRHIITGEAHKPLAGRGTPDCDGFDIPLNRPGQEEFELADTGNIQVPSFNLPSGLLQSEGIISVFSPEPGESGLFAYILAPAKEGVKSTIETLQNILQDLRSNFKLRKFLFKSRKLSLLSYTRNRFAILPVNIDFLLKSQIIECAAYFEPLKAISLSLFIYYGSVLECSSHFLVCASIYFLIVSLLTLPAVLTKYECVQRDGILSRYGNSFLKILELTPLNSLTILCTGMVG